MGGSTTNYSETNYSETSFNTIWHTVPLKKQHVSDILPSEKKGKTMDHCLAALRGLTVLYGVFIFLFD